MVQSLLEAVNFRQDPKGFGRRVAGKIARGLGGQHGTVHVAQLDLARGLVASGPNEPFQALGYSGTVLLGRWWLLFE